MKNHAALRHPFSSASRSCSRRARPLHPHSSLLAAASARASASPTEPTQLPCHIAMSRSRPSLRGPRPARPAVRAPHPNGNATHTGHRHRGLARPRLSGSPGSLPVHPRHTALLVTGALCLSRLAAVRCLCLATRVAGCGACALLYRVPARRVQIIFKFECSVKVIDEIRSAGVGRRAAACAAASRSIRLIKRLTDHHWSIRTSPE